MQRALALLAGLVACSSAAAPPATVASPPPPPPPPPRVEPRDPAVARVDDVVETIAGKQVHDPYRWMESGGAEYDAYLAAQDQKARAALRAIPNRDKLRDLIHAVNRGVTRVTVIAVTGPAKAPRIFLFKREPDDEVAQLYMRDGWSGADKLLVDPRTRDAGGVHHALDNVAPAPDGKHVAYGIAAAGSEDSTIEILDIDRNTVLPERIDRAQYAQIDWRDARSFFYWRRKKPAATDTKADWFKYSATYLHVPGEDPEQAQALFGPAIAELGIPVESFSGIDASAASNWVLAYASPGTSADSEYFVAPKASVVPGAKIPWRRITGPHDQVNWVFAHGDTLYAYTYANAPNYRIVAFDAKAGTLATAKVLLPEESKAVMNNVVPAQDGIYVEYIAGGPSVVRRYDWNGKLLGEVKVPFVGTISPGGDELHAGIVFSAESWTRSRDYFQFTPAGGVKNLGIVKPWPDDYSDLVAEEVMATSADGTTVPLSIVSPKTAPRDGSLPALLEGYSAYGVSARPSFWPTGLAWVKRGGVYAVCHARGGGELGKQWQLTGTKHAKENGVDDFIACAEYLVKERYTTTARLTVTGTSAGGMLAGGAITKRPELYAAALLRVPMVNVMRFEQTEGGLANVPELGSLSNQGDVPYMLATDPYHRIKPGTAYPAILVTAGKHDVRVPNWLPAKFVARMQPATTSGKPVLLRVESDAGHGVGSSRTQVEEEWADLFAFALSASGVAL